MGRKGGRKNSMVACSSNISTWKGEAKGSWLQGHPSVLHSNFKASLGYMTSCHKQRKPQNNGVGWVSTLLNRTGSMFLSTQSMTEQAHTIPDMGLLCRAQ